MNNQTEIALLEWLAAHGVTNEQLDQAGTDLHELLEDYTQLTEAIRYWTGQSREKVAEFTDLANELKQEMLEMVATVPAHRPR